MYAVFGHFIEKIAPIYLIEVVQGRAARFVVNCYSRYQSVTSILQELDWTTLHKIRDHSLQQHTPVDLYIRSYDYTVIQCVLQLFCSTRMTDV